MSLIENVRGLSYWHRTIENSIVPEDPLRGDHKCHVAIIGAGYSGLWTAYYLKQIEPDLDIAIIEAEFAGRGAAGRNGGWCSLNLPGFEELARNPKTASQAKEILPHLFQMVDEVGNISATEGTDCDYHKGGVVHVAVTDSQERSARRLHETFAALGVGEAQVWLEKSEMDQKVRMENGRGGTYSPHCAVVHPAKLALGLANHLKKIGVTFYEQSPVTSLSQGKAATALGSMADDKIVVATEGYTHSEPGLPKNRFLPVHAFMTVTEPLSDHVFNEIGINNREAFADFRALVTYGQRTVDNRLAFGYGARTYLNGKPRDTFSQDDELFGIIQQILEMLFPVLKGVKYEQNWGGAM